MPSQTAINDEKRNSLLISHVRIVALIAAISSLIALLFEVKYFSEQIQIVYLTRLAGASASFIILIISFANFGRKYSAFLIHLIIFSVIGSFGYIGYLIPHNLVLNSFIVGLLLFTFALMINWTIIHQIVVAFLYNLIFTSSIMISDGSFYFLSGKLEASLFVILLGATTIVANYINFSKRKKALFKLVEVNDDADVYKEIFENEVDGMFQSTVEGNFIRVNPALVKILGYDSDEELLNKNLLEDLFCDPAEREQLQKILDKNGRVKHYRIAVKRYDGKEIIARLNCRVIHDEAGDPVIYEGSIQDITNQNRIEQERKAALADMRDKKLNAEKKAEKAIGASVAKTQFLANMSHEIRTPMNSVLGFLTLIEDDMFESPEELKEFAGNARMSAESLLNIINNILDISKIEAGRMELDEHEFDLKEEVQKAFAMVTPKADEKRISLGYRIEEGVPAKFIGDSSRYRQILVNLLNNAVKFTDVGGVSARIKYEKISESSGRLLTKVKDTGIGVPEDKIPILFQPYSQVKDKKHKEQGAGLGLMICKEFVRLMDGDISVESESGEGTTFRFSVVMEPADFGLIERTNSPEKETANDLITLTSNNNNGTDFSNLETRVNGHKRLLLVEDNQASQDIEMKILRDVGYSVEAVSNGLEAIEAVKSSKFDLVLMDVEMAEMDGVTATKRIRQLPGEVSRVPIIAVTAHSSMRDRQKCLRAGMNDYIAKPINVHFMKMTIDQWLNESTSLAG